MIKKILLLFTTLLIAGCSLFADSKSYNLGWTPNIEEDMSHYELYVWSGLDTSLCPLIDEAGISSSSPMYVKNILHPDSFTTFIEIADGVSYVRAGLVAVDLYGNRSGLGVSNFLLTPDNSPPSKPKNVLLTE